MPEGPEVRRCGDQLGTMIRHKELVEIVPRSGKLSRQISHTPVNATVREVETKGKAIFVVLDNGQQIISTLGMSGWWYPRPELIREDHVVYYQGRSIQAREIVEAAMKHTRVELVTENDRVFYVDPRNFGNFKLVSNDEAESYRRGLGIDVMHLKSAAEAVNAIRKLGKYPIAEALVDQKTVCGLGNIYRAETLYLARINPFRLVSDLSDDELYNIFVCAYSILNIAYTFEGQLPYPRKFIESTLGLSLDIEGPVVYGRKTDVFGNAVNTDKSAGRTLWWVPSIQLGK